ncbi:MAG: hypothetical protein NC078_01670 [Ruminococcus sp.]|nr:hypothetical protein [Ruminococcus sp.]
MNVNEFKKAFSVRIYGKDLIIVNENELVCTQALVSFTREETDTYFGYTAEYTDIIIKEGCRYDSEKRKYYDFEQEVIYKESYAPNDNKGIAYTDLGDRLFKLGERYYCSKKIQGIERISANESRADYGDYFLVCTADGEGNSRTNFMYKRVYKDDNAQENYKNITEIVDLGDGLFSFGENIFNAMPALRMVKASDNETRMEFEKYDIIVTADGSGGERHNIKWKRTYKEGKNGTDT